MYKKIVGMALVLALSVSVFANKAQAVSTLREGDFEYVLVDGKAHISDYLGNDATVHIPEKLGEKEVSEICSLREEGAKKIKTIVLPKTMVKSEKTNSSLWSCSNLEKIEVDVANQNLVAQDGVLFSKDKKELLAYPCNKAGEEYTEPDTVENSVGLCASENLKKVTFSKNPNCIETGNCASMKSLETVVIPSNIKKIRANGFEDCTNLKNVIWSDSITTIGARAFSSCALTEVKIPKNVQSIQAEAFAGCDKLSKVTLPFGLKEIGYHAFLQGKQTLKKVKLPDSVLEVKMGAFNAKTKVTKAPYLKRKVHNYGTYKSYSYLAKAKVEKNKKVKNYLAKNITKIKGQKSKIKLDKKAKATLNTKVYINKKYKGLLGSDILKFKSLNKKVVKVNKNGVVTGLKKGSAKIEVTLRTTRESYKVKVVVK